MKKIVTIQFVMLSILMAAIYSCKKNNDSSLSEQVKTDTIRLDNYFYGAQKEQNNSFVNLYDKEVYSEYKVAAIPSLSEKVDFGYVYKYESANSLLRMLANPDYLSTTSTSVKVPLINWSVKVNSFIGSTTMTTSDFDNIKSIQDLNNQYEKQKDKGSENGKKVNLNQSYETDLLRQPPVFLFTDHAGRKGFIRLLPYTAKTSQSDPSPIRIIIKLIK